MAKEDFCYTHYDGDEARDVSHMSRLERGSYGDIRMAQRKFGPLSLDQIIKILGRDFEETWPSVELVLKKTDEGLYYIEWLFNSIQKMKAHAKKQSGNRFGKTKQQPNNNQIQPNNNPQKPLEDGNGDGDEKGFQEGGTGETESLFINELPKDIELTKMQENNSIEFIRLQAKKTLTAQEVQDAWQAFKIDNFSKREWYATYEDVLSHFRRSLVKKIINESNSRNTSKTGNRSVVTEETGFGRL